jgi:hypothetical protein
MDLDPSKLLLEYFYVILRDCHAPYVPSFFLFDNSYTRSDDGKVYIFTTAADKYHCEC